MTRAVPPPRDTDCLWTTPDVAGLYDLQFVPPERIEARPAFPVRMGEVLPWAGCRSSRPPGVKEGKWEVRMQPGNGARRSRSTCMPDDDMIGALFVETYNLDLVALPSSARVAMPADGAVGMLELRDAANRVLCLIPADTSPVVADIACRLHADGMRLGEETAFAKLRRLIGAGGSTTDTA